MPHSEFKNPVFRPDGRLEVRGPFRLGEVRPEDVQGEILIRFLLMQDIPATDPAGPKRIIVNGAASLEPTGVDDEWHTVLEPARCGDLRGSTQTGNEGRCRGIGQAVLFRNQPGTNPVDLDDPPPLFDTVTWCITTEVLNAGVTRP
jgi:hypothetical protein